MTKQRIVRSVSVATLLLLAGCSGLGYRSDCIEVVFGDFDLDATSGMLHFSGGCVRKTHPSCPDLKDFKLELGVDQNANGQLDPSEVTSKLEDPNPGSQLCVASGSFNVGAGNQGKKLIVHYEVSAGTGPDRKEVSKTESKTIK